MLIQKINDLKIVCSPEFSGSFPIRHGFCTRAGGYSREAFQSLNLSFHVGDHEKNVQKNREVLAKGLDFSLKDLITLRQVHGKKVFIYQSQKPELECDAIITKQKKKVIGVSTADCYSILFYDPKSQAIGAAHAGWRGVAKNVMAETLDALRSNFGCDPKNLKIAIGPGIGACCFEVGDEVLDALGSLHKENEKYFIKKSSGKWHADLENIIYQNLIKLGVPEASIARVSLCTYCQIDLFFSYRRDGKNSGRHLNFIELKG